MNRRIAIRNMALILGSTVVLPSCLNDDKGKPVIALKYLKLNASQETLVTNVVETILPKTNTPGAKDLGINLFVFKMIDDCLPKAAQDEFMAGLDEFEATVKKQYGHSFNECTVAERTAFIKNIDQQNKEGKGKKAKAGGDEQKNEVAKLVTFYNIVKGQTVFGYTTSQYFMTKQVVYELVPGRYNAYYPVKKQSAV